MSNPNIEAYNSSSDVGEKIAPGPASGGSAEGAVKSVDSPVITRPNRQDRLSFDNTHENSNTGKSSSNSEMARKSALPPVPKRTSSAPPEEHENETHKHIFQPTKTSHGLISSPVDTLRKQATGNRSKTNSFSEQEVLPTPPPHKNHSALSPAVIRSPAVAALFERGEGDYVPKISLGPSSGEKKILTPRTAEGVESEASPAGSSDLRINTSGSTGGIASRDSPQSGGGSRNEGGYYKSDYNQRGNYNNRQYSRDGNTGGRGYRNNQDGGYNSGGRGGGGRGDGQRYQQPLNPHSAPFNFEGGYRPPQNNYMNNNNNMNVGMMQQPQQQANHYNPNFHPQQQMQMHQMQQQMYQMPFPQMQQLPQMHIPMQPGMPIHDQRFPHVNVPPPQMQYQPVPQQYQYMSVPPQMQFAQQGRYPGQQPQYIIPQMPPVQMPQIAPAHPSFGVGVTSEQLKSVGSQPPAVPPTHAPVPVNVDNSVSSPSQQSIEGVKPPVAEPSVTSPVAPASPAQPPMAPPLTVGGIPFQPGMVPQQYMYQQQPMLQQQMYMHQPVYQQQQRMIVMGQQQPITTLPNGNMAPLMGGHLPQGGSLFYPPAAGLGIATNATLPPMASHQPPQLGMPPYPHHVAQPLARNMVVGGIPIVPPPPHNPNIPTHIPSTSTTPKAADSAATSGAATVASSVTSGSASTETPSVTAGEASSEVQETVAVEGSSMAAPIAAPSAVVYEQQMIPPPQNNPYEIMQQHNPYEVSQLNPYDLQQQQQQLPPQYPAQSMYEMPPTRPRKALSYSLKSGETLDLKTAFGKPAPPVETSVSSESTAVAVTESTESAVKAAAVPPAEQQPVVAVENAPAVAAPVSMTPELLEPLQALRISSPSLDEVDNAKTDLIHPSPIVKNVNIPVTLAPAVTGGYSITRKNATDSPVTTTDAVSSSAVESASTASGSVAFQVQKKRSKKEMLAAADKAGPVGSSDLLSAYSTIAPVAAPAPVSEPVVIAPPQATTPTSQDDSLPDSWDDDSAPAIIAAAAAVVEPAATKGRSLRPGGVKTTGGPTRSLNGGYAARVYTKAELMALKPPPEEKLTNPFGTMYTNVSIQGEGGNARGGPGGSNYGGGGWPKQQPRDRERGDSRGGSAHHSSNNSFDAGGHDAGWKRDTNLPPPPQQMTNKRGGKQSNVPMPKKQVSGPMEALALEVMGILNKITPQTFEKLSAKILSLELSNTAMLDKLIELIFEKAVQEPNFTVVYADLCSYLTNNATNWTFYMIVRDLGTNDYFWIKDFAFDAVAAGPFYSQKECFNAVSGEELPEMQPLTVTPDSAEVFLTNNILTKIVYNNSTRQYFLTYVPFTKIDEEMRSLSTFSEEEAARKDAKKKNNFRSRLVNSCQIEFDNSVKNESAYALLEKSRESLLAEKANMSETDFAVANAAIEEERLKLKRRMMGNIRFVGELYKQTLLQTGTMHDCIEELLGSQASGWKDMRDEQDIELLCRLLTTVGETLEAKSQTSKDRKHSQLFESYFERLYELTRDKTLNSRMRFSIEEVITLRRNRWQARRQQEGPLKIAEIHQRVMEEEARLLMIQQQPQAFHRGGPVQPSRGGPGPQQQPLQAQPPRTIMSRNPSSTPRGGGGVSPATNKGGRGGGTPRSTPEDAHVKFGRTTSVGPGMGDARALGSEFLQEGGGNLRRLNSEPNAARASPTAASGRGGRGGSAPSSAASVPLTFNDHTAEKEMKGALVEYLGNNNDIAELRLRLSEAPSKLYYVYLVLKIMQKYVDAKAAVQQSLLLVLKDEELGAVLRTLTLEVETALANFEPLKLLVDTTVDIKEAPERFATVVSHLVRAGIVPMQRMSNMAEDLKAFNVDEGNYDTDEISRIFGRFLNTLLQSNDGK